MIADAHYPLSHDLPLDYSLPYWWLCSTRRLTAASWSRYLYVFSLLFCDLLNLLAIPWFKACDVWLTSWLCCWLDGLLMFIIMLSRSPLWPFLDRVDAWVGLMMRDPRRLEVVALVCFSACECCKRLNLFKCPSNFCLTWPSTVLILALRPPISPNETKALAFAPGPGARMTDPLYCFPVFSTYSLVSAMPLKMFTWPEAIAFVAVAGAIFPSTDFALPIFLIASRFSWKGLLSGAGCSGVTYLTRFNIIVVYFDYL